MRKVLNIEQGSDSWKAHRSTPGMINGSEIAAIMGLSTYVSRSDLVRQKATGIEPEHDAATLARFEAGHEAEALGRAIAEEIVGDDLSPMVMTDEIDGLLFSVSLDGITFDGITTFEHKLASANLSRSLGDAVIPEQYSPQLEAGLMVSGATRCLFMASRDGDKATERHAWYESDPELRKRMIAACKQFNEDVKNYVHVEVIAAPVAATIEALPALFVQVEGRVLATNLDAFKTAAQTFIDGIKTELVCDQDFVDADNMVKFLKDGEERLALAKSQALAQTASIDALFRTVDTISEQMRGKRLALTKLVQFEKDNRRAYIVADAQQELVAHVTKLNERIGGNWMQRTEVSFADAIKGMKSLDSMREKVGNALRDAMLDANELADTIDSNRSIVPGDLFSVLMPDFAAVCTKNREDFANLLDARIAAHKEAEARREADRITREAAQADAQAKAQAAQDERDHQAQEDQRGKADSGITAPACGRITAAPDAGIALVDGLPVTQPVAASTPPNTADEAMIDAFLRLLSITPAAKKEMRGDIIRWETYRLKVEAAAVEAWNKRNGV